MNDAVRVVLIVCKVQNFIALRVIIYRRLLPTAGRVVKVLRSVEAVR